MTNIESKAPAKTTPSYPDFFEWRPLETLRREINSLFNQVPARTSLPDFEPFERFFTSAAQAPAVEVSEKEKEFVIAAELPGLDEKNVDLKLSNGLLTISGEKKDEREQKEKDYYFSERRYGSFRRSFRVPENVDTDKIEASFNKGVLTIRLPKTAESQKAEKKIDIKSK
jgi:HSP20 family protein